MHATSIFYARFKSRLPGGICTTRFLHTRVGTVQGTKEDTGITAGPGWIPYFRTCVSCSNFQLSVGLLASFVYTIFL